MNFQSSAPTLTVRNWRNVAPEQLLLLRILGGDGVSRPVNAELDRRACRRSRNILSMFRSPKPFPAA